MDMASPLPSNAKTSRRSLFKALDARSLHGEFDPKP